MGALQWLGKRGEERKLYGVVSSHPGHRCLRDLTDCLPEARGEVDQEVTALKAKIAELRKREEGLRKKLTAALERVIGSIKEGKKEARKTVREGR